MIAAVSIGAGAPQLVSSRQQDGARTGRWRWQDKRTGTFEVHVVDGVGDFPGPVAEVGGGWDKIRLQYSSLSGTFPVEPRHGG